MLKFSVLFTLKQYRKIHDDIQYIRYKYRNIKINIKDIE